VGYPVQHLKSSSLTPLQIIEDESVEIEDSLPPRIDDLPNEQVQHNVST